MGTFYPYDSPGKTTTFFFCVFTNLDQTFMMLHMNFLCLFLEGTLNTSTVCSHIRAWQLFLESLKQENGDCQFVAYSCPRGPPCFPPLQACGLPNSCAVMGLHSENSQARGPLYLVTRESSPFCGKISIFIHTQCKQLWRDK